MKNLIVFIIGALLCACTSANDPFKAYEQAFNPVKLGHGTLSTDSVQWNNAYASQTKELYFTKMGTSSSSIFKMNVQEGSFTNMKQIPLPEGSPHSDVFINAKGNLMLFSSLMKAYEEDTITNWNIWKSSKQNGKWQAPEPFFDRPQEGNQFYPWLTNSGNIYFATTPHGSANSDLFVSKLSDGKYKNPLPLSTINSEHLEGDAFVSADESFMIFASFDRPENLGKSDLFISFQQEGIWSTPLWLGKDINSEGYDGSPFITEDGKYLIFTSSRGSSDENTFFNHYILRFEIEKFKSQIKQQHEK